MNSFMPLKVGVLRVTALWLFALLVLSPSVDAEKSGTYTISYTVEDLGVLPGDYSSVAQGINASGQVVGWSTGTMPRAYLYTDGIGMTELANLSGLTLSVAYDINDAGVVVGYGAANYGAPEHALRWVTGVPEDLGMLESSSVAWGVNSGGQVAGVSPAFALTSHALLYGGSGGMTDIIPSSFTSCAYDINDNGVVVGYFVTFNSNHAFRWTSSNGLEDIGANIPGHSYAFAINVSGQIAGTMSSASGHNVHLFRYTEGLGAVDLGFSSEAQVWGMNAQGDIVGDGRLLGGLRRAFIYTDEHGQQAINDLIDPALGWFLKSATGINDAGQIVGYGLNNLTGQSHAVRLTPISQPEVSIHLALNPVVVEGSSTVTAWITLPVSAPPGGAMVQLSTDSPAMIVLPASVVIDEGSRDARFELATAVVVDTTRATIEANYQGAVSIAALVINPSGTCICACYGDPGGNCDGVQSVLDVVQVVDIAFRGGSAIVDPNVNCPYETSDVNCTNSTDVLDVVKIVNVAFRGANAVTEFCDPCGP